MNIIHKFLVLFVFLFYAFQLKAQTYTKVNHLTGTQKIGGLNVTVAGYNTPGINSFCGASPYHIGQNNSNYNTTGYVFSFAAPVEKIRIQTTATDAMEIFTMFINGTFYSVVPANLSSYAGSCMCPYNLTLINGRIAAASSVALNGNVGFQVDLALPGGISSIQFNDSVVSGGSVFNFYFFYDSTFVIKQPFTDTIKCLGDSLKLSYTVSHRCAANNVFTAQLSDANGSFAFPLNIGTLAYDTSGTISCYIPTSVPQGQGYKLRVVSSAPVDTTLDNGKNIRISAYPDSIIAASNTPVCTADSIKFSASSTTAGIIYQWTGPNGFNSTNQNPFIASASSAAAGNYIASYNNFGCIARDTLAVVVKPLPAKPIAASNTPVCPGTNLQLTGSALASGVTRSWSGPNNFSSNLQNASKNNVAYSDAGNYIVTDTLNGCIAKDTELVVIMITTPTPTASSNNPVCLGGIINFVANGTAGAIYNWTGPGNFSMGGQNAQRTNITAADSGIYYVTQKVNGCVSMPATVSVSTVHGPYVSVYASPKDTICAGINGALVSIPFGIGPQGATYEWYKNGSFTGVTTGNYIVPNVNNGDKFYVQMLATGSVCNTPVQSNTVTLTVLPATAPPAATIAANPGTDVWPGLNVNFSISNLANGGTNPGYQWLRNSKNITGATANKWNTTDLKDGDSICLLVTSSNQCATPKTASSNCLVMKVPVTIDPLQASPAINVYPNPNNGNFIIESKESGALYVYNMQGQEVTNYQISSGKSNISLIQPTGIYLGKFISENGNATLFRLIIE